MGYYGPFKFEFDFFSFLNLKNIMIVSGPRTAYLLQFILLCIGYFNHNASMTFILFLIFVVVVVVVNFNDIVHPREYVCR